MKAKGFVFAVLLAVIAALLCLNRSKPGDAPLAERASVQPATARLPAHFIHDNQPQPVEGRPTNHFREYLNDTNSHKLTAEQVQAYLQANHRNAESLLAGLHTTGDRAFLREAMERFPHDPKVAYTALFFGNLSPEESRQWADNFKQSAPGNTMADYASALNYLKSGQTDLAMQDMATAAKGSWTDYSWQFMESSEEAYRSAGYSDIDAKIASQAPFELPDLAPLKQLGVQLNQLAQSYQQAGNAAAAQSTLQLDLQLGQQLSATDAQPLITTLVGMAVEKIALSSMDPNAPYGNTGQTVQDQINQLTQQRQYIRDITAQFETVQPTMSDQDILSFYERRQAFGEPNAMQWAVSKYSPQ